ncbi:Guanylate cyclase 32E [Cyphomyrmex costatus]|uniref:Guanylate cyclase n=1 Tax=Cyphomyrmex costatus TaxID=456900 RepID=A0A151IK90_9HYME|nr:Guanylate cyclase 32E [Cyphomyrmex costatus]
MLLANMERMCLFLMVIYVLLVNKSVDAETFTLGYITGSKRRETDYEYQRPGLLISGAITLAVEEAILLEMQVNAGELGRRGHSLNFIVSETYGDEEISIKNTAELWKKNVSAYIGPQETCVHEAKMAAAFNLPMLSYFCTHNETSNKKEFPTFVRTRPPDSQIIKSVISVLKLFNWYKVTFLFMNSTIFEFNKMSTLATTMIRSFEAAGINFNYRRSWNEPYHMNYTKNPFYKLVHETYRHTRIYVILGHYYEHMGLLIALEEKNLPNKGDYFVVGIDIEQYDDHQPKKYLKGLWETKLNKTIKIFKNYFSIMASAPINFKNFSQLVNKYREKPPFNFTNPSANVGGIVQIVPETAYLYDAVHLYATALVNALDNKKDPRNGKEMMEKLRDTYYKSAMGYLVHLDENGDAEGNYTLVALANVTGYGLYPFGYFIAKQQGTNLPNLRLHKDISWFGKGPPKAEPYCGFYGEKCNPHNGKIISGIIALILIIMTVSLIFYKKWQSEQDLDNLSWKINYNDIMLINEGRIETNRASGKEYKRILTIESYNRRDTIKTVPLKKFSETSLNSNLDIDFPHSVIYTQVGYFNNQILTIKKMKGYIEITKNLNKELKMMRNVRHQNLNSFIGACIESSNIYMIVDYCSRGSLKDILKNDKIILNKMFISSIVFDIIRGMIYLHGSVIQFHGSLIPSNCLIDIKWTVKLSDFGLQQLRINKAFDFTHIRNDDTRWHGLLYKAPELLRITRAKQLKVHDFKRADVYSFAIILYELHGRHGPFGITDLTVDQILQGIVTNNELLRPPLDQVENMLDFVRDCLLECWSENPKLRPDFKSIKDKLNPLRDGIKKNIFDNMMAIMTKQSNHLEVLVDERTKQLVEEKVKTDALLYKMIPPSVAEKLKMGQEVEAESYDCVTIYFSDIVGFTSMSAKSTPLEMITFLNDLYTCFDSTIEPFDVYKIETIGDAYMVVSGLPMRNGIRHAREIANMSLTLLEIIKQFTIRHIPSDELLLRIGIHSGPVCAGIVGSKMPRYCLFGDTVNTASRMESTGLPLRIHCSLETKQLLDELGGFRLVERGSVFMKGKGLRLTYWLIGSKSISESDEETPSNDNKNNNVTIVSVHKSSPKNESLVKSTFTRCSNDFPQRLQTSSLNQLDQKGSKSDTIIDISPRKIACELRLSCSENWQSSSNSCPCIKHLFNQEAQSEQIKHELSSNISNASLLHSCKLKFGDKSCLVHPAANSFRFNALRISQFTYNSISNSMPEHTIIEMDTPERLTQSYQEIDRLNANTPLLCYPGGHLDSNSLNQKRY